MKLATSPVALAKPQILRDLDHSASRVFSREEFDSLLSHNREGWGLANSITTNKVIKSLAQEGELRIVKFEFPARNIYRYVRGEVAPLEIIQSLKPRAYFSHYSAVALQGLTDQVPKSVFLNFEQHLSAGGGDLSQDRIHRAFKGKCRVSHNTASLGDYLVTILNGANTGQLGVVDLETSQGSRLRTTNIERTLLDITVRPVYAGGVFEVARAYEAARDKLSVPRLVKMLKTLNYTYPYHQSVGFYLERAGGYPAAEIEQLREFPREFDFYLEYGMRQTDYHERWRLFTPQGF